MMPILVKNDDVEEEERPRLIMGGYGRHRRQWVKRRNKLDHFLVPFLSMSSFENELRQLVHFHEDQTHFHMKVFTQEFILKQRHKVTGKWPILTH